MVKKEREWIGIIGSRFVDVFENIEDELDIIVSNIKSKGRGILLSSAPGIDCRTLAYLLKYHADDLEFQVHMDQSFEEFEDEMDALVEKEMLDVEEAQYTIDQLKRLQKERPEALKIVEPNEEAIQCGRYASVIADCDAIFAIKASSQGSPIVEKTIEFANNNGKPVREYDLCLKAA